MSNPFLKRDFERAADRLKNRKTLFEESKPSYLQNALDNYRYHTLKSKMKPKK
jgi:hypothetical protein